MKTMALMAVVGGLAGRAAGQGFTFIEPPNGVSGSAYGISEDGRTVAGRFASSAIGYEAGFVWRDGVTTLVQAPGNRPKMGLWGISGDGRTQVGWGSSSLWAGYQACRVMPDGTYQNLGLPALCQTAQAHDASRDGSVVVGWGTLADGFSQRAFRWTQSGGMQIIGPTRGGNFFNEARAVSADGNTVVGAAMEPPTAMASCGPRPTGFGFSII